MCSRLPCISYTSFHIVYENCIVYIFKKLRKKIDVLLFVCCCLLLFFYFILYLSFIVSLNFFDGNNILVWNTKC